MENNSPLTKTNLDMIRSLKKDPRNFSRIARKLNVSIVKVPSEIKNKKIRAIA